MIDYTNTCMMISKIVSMKTKSTCNLCQVVFLTVVFTKTRSWLPRMQRGIRYVRYVCTLYLLISLTPQFCRLYNSVGTHELVMISSGMS